jgi:hypothetical protein
MIGIGIGNPLSLMHQDAGCEGLKKKKKPKR